MLARLWQSLCGYVMINVEGLSLERFLNLALTNGIRIWDVRRDAYTRLSAKVNRKGFFQLRRLLRGMNCRLRIAEKRGVAGHLGVIKRRFVLVWGSAAAFALLLAATSFLWQVRFTGVGQLDEGKLRNAVERAGVRAGMLLRDIDLRRVEKAVTNADEHVAWAGAYIKGVQLVVEVVEGKKPPKLVDKDTPAHVVSMKSAVVLRVTALEGVAKVKAGDSVREGDVLISGEFERVDGPPRLVHARGEVVGRVWYGGRAVIAPMRNVKKRTGRRHVVEYLFLSDWRLPMLGGEDFALYETREIERYQMQGLYLPLYWVKEEHYELKETQEILDAEEMLITGKTLAFNEAIGKADQRAEIVGRTERVSKEKDGRLVVELFLEAEEPIGTTQAFEAEWKMDN